MATENTPPRGPAIGLPRFASAGPIRGATIPLRADGVQETPVKPQFCDPAPGPQYKDSATGPQDLDFMAAEHEALEAAGVPFEWRDALRKSLPASPEEGHPIPGGGAA